MPSRSKALIIGPFLAIAVFAGCSSSGASTAPATQPPATQEPASQAPASQAPASVAPSAAPSASAASSGVTVEAKSIGSIGTALVAGSNGMTVYSFTQDVKDSGKSNCTGGCLTTWPAVTVPAGTTPSGGPGVSGKFGTFTRADDGTTQVTYNGLPLYFFANDHAPGDTNGIYENWNAVKP